MITDNANTGPASPKKEKGDPDHSFGEQVASFPGLAALTKGDREALDEIKQLIRAPPVIASPIRAPPDGVLSPTPEPIENEKLRDLNRLAEMATTLGEIAVSAPVWITFSNRCKD